MNIPSFHFIAASHHTQVKSQAVPGVSFLALSLHSVCSEESCCLPYTNKSLMAELTATTLRSHPKLMQQLTADLLPQLMLTISKRFSSPLSSLLAHHLPCESSLAISIESPGSITTISHPAQCRKVGCLPSRSIQYLRHCLFRAPVNKSYRRTLQDLALLGNLCKRLPMLCTALQKQKSSEV